MPNPSAPLRALRAVPALAVAGFLCGGTSGCRERPAAHPEPTSSDASPAASFQIPAAPGSEGPGARQSELAACKAAAARIPEDYRPSLGGNLAAVESYRAAWRRACSGPAGQSLAPLLGKVTELIRAGVLRFSGDAPDEIHPSTWVPGFNVDPYTIGGDVDARAFTAAAELIGLPEDRAFWGIRTQFESGRWGDPWTELRKETDFATCLKLTEIDWSREYGRLAEAAAASSGRAYQDWATGEAKKLAELLGWFDRYKAVCACRSGKTPEVVFEGLARAAAAGGVEGARVARAAKAAVDAVREKRVTIQYEWDKPDVTCTLDAMPSQSPVAQ